MMIPIDAHVYELWANFGTNPWDSGELGTFTASVLAYGPEGCGKTYLAEVFCAVSGRKEQQLDAVEILKKPESNLAKQLNAAKSDQGCRLLIEDIDNLFTNLRAYPSAHRLLWKYLKQPPSEMVIFATARRPDVLSADELDVFKYVLPVFYRDQLTRELTMAAHAESIPLEPFVDLQEISEKTEWWSAQELKDLITRSPLTPSPLYRPGILTQETLLQRVIQISSNIVAEHRRKRTQELLRFTADHCTSNYIRADIAFRFGSKLEVPEIVPAPPNITFIVEQVIMKQEIKQAGVVVNPGAQASNFNVDQTFNEASQGVDLGELALALVALRKALQTEPDSPEKPMAIAAVTAAEDAAKRQDGPSALQHLKSAGKWAFDVATKIGTTVAAKAIQMAMGL